MDNLGIYIYPTKCYEIANHSRPIMQMNIHKIEAPLEIQVKLYGRILFSLVGLRKQIISRLIFKMVEYHWGSLEVIEYHQSPYIYTEV